jgi:phosphoribosyl 1,2-cyclic phosphodiesterase
MEVIALQSGSNGNCIYVEAGGRRLLFDAGISGKQAQSRLAQHGRDITAVDALLISHDHVDHSRSMGIYQRKFGVPVYVTTKTFQTACRYGLGEMNDLRHFLAGETLQFGNISVETIPTPHDGVDGVAFVIDDGRHRLGILTDLGHVFNELEEVIRSLDAVVLESNYDPDMLAHGLYPDFLKRRIQGPGGHISNIESAHLLRSVAGGRLQWACLAHLSHDNNTPELAVKTHRRIVGHGLPIHLAHRDRASEVLQM